MASRRFGVIATMLFLCALLPPAFLASAQGRWTRIFYLKGKQYGIGLKEAVAFSGGGYLGMGGNLVNGHDSLLVWRWDSQGNLLWMKQYAQKADLGELLDNGDGTFTVTATNWDHAAETPPIPPWGWVIVCDGSGNILSQWDCALVATGLAARARTGDVFLSALYSDNFWRLDGVTGSPVWYKMYIPTANPSPFGEEATAIRATPDGGFVFSAGSGTSENSAVLVRATADGQVLWAKNYQSDASSDSTPSWPQVSVTPDGGFLLIANTTSSSVNDTTLFRLDPSGAILWQERLVSADYPQMSPAMIWKATEGSDGTILVWGSTGYLDGRPGLSEIPFLATLDPAGTPLWCQVYESPPISDDSFVDAWPVEGGYLFASAAFDMNVNPNRAGPSLSKVDLSGAGSPSCNNFPFNIVAQTTTYGSQELPMSVTDFGSFPVNATHARPKEVARVRDTVVCGDAIITAVTKLSSPFRLELTGWNFQDGSVAFINGVQAPSSTLREPIPPSPHQMKMVIGRGNQLKALLPKGQPVCITIQNPDGQQSDCFAFTR